MCSANSCIVTSRCCYDSHLFLQVEVIKKAYMQGEIEVEEPQEGEDGEEEHSASPRNVGHNIYILAHQVSRYKIGVDRGTHHEQIRPVDFQ